MNIQSLTYFIQVADARSYSVAAKKIYVAQSSLSTAVKKLEEELSVKLFNYDGKSLNLTMEGERFYELAKEFLSSYELFFESAKKITDDVFGTINILLPILVSDIFFSEPLAEFQKKYPDVKINVTNRGGYQTQNLISVNEYDIGVTIKPLIQNTFECIDIAKSPMVLAVHESNPLADKEEVTYEELVYENFLSYEEDSVLYQNFISKTKDAGYAPQILMKAAETPLLLSVIEKGTGVLVVPECVVDYRKYSNIRVIPIRGEDEGYQLIMVYNKDKYLSTASVAFIDFIKEWYQDKEKKNG
ncbi:MAG: LysR family transcriptional regulator [Firmicutes bacterium]|nr:LysR family transcriptional regulator [Bacillota bacterium]